MQIENLEIISAANEEIEELEAQLVALISQWQDRASLSLTGLAQGLREAADDLEALLDKRQEGAEG